MTDALRTSRARLLAAVGLAALSAVLVLVATRHGPGVSPDSVEYVASARNLVAGRGFTGAAADSVTLWPPGLPAILATGLHLGIEPSTTARVLNATAMAAIVLLTFVLLSRHVRSTGLVLIATALVAVSPTLLRTADMIWTEPLFCALLLGFVVLLEQLVRDRGHRIELLVACAVIVWAAALVRWAGIALIPAGMVAIAVAPSRTGTRGERASRALGFVALASVVPLLWLVRNATTGDSLAGHRAGQSDSLSELGRRVLVAMGRTVVPNGAPDALTELAAVVLVVAFVGGAVLALSARPPGGDAASEWPMTPLVAVVGFLLVLLFASFFFEGMDVSARILAPVYAPLVVIGFALFERAREQARDAGHDRLAIVVAGAFLGWLALVVVWAGGLVWDHGREARGFAAPVWARSALVHAAGRAEPRAVLYTNEPLPVVTITRRYPVLDARELRHGCADPSVLAIYGTHTPVPGAYAKAGVEVTELRRVDDGTVYRVDCGADGSRARSAE